MPALQACGANARNDDDYRVLLLLGFMNVHWEQPCQLPAKSAQIRSNLVTRHLGPGNLSHIGELDQCGLLGQLGAPSTCVVLPEDCRYRYDLIDCHRSDIDMTGSDGMPMSWFGWFGASL